jgi:hypothetical protein
VRSLRTRLLSNSFQNTFRLIVGKMADTTERTTVTLDRREHAGRRTEEDRRGTDQRKSQRRSEERRNASKPVDFSERRLEVRRDTADRRQTARRSDSDRRDENRREDQAADIVITEEDIKRFESAPPSSKRLLSQVLLILGLLLLLTRI